MRTPTPSKFSFSLMNADYVQLNKTWDYKNVASPFYRLYLIDDGEGRLSTSEQNILIEKDHLYLIPSFTVFNQSCASYLSQYYIHIFEETADGSSLFANNKVLMKLPATEMDKYLMQRIATLNPSRGLHKSDNPKVYEKAEIMRDFLELNNRLSVADLLETKGILLQLLARFAGSTQFTHQAITPVPYKIQEAIAYIEANISTMLTVGTLAERANQSRDHFSKLFYQQTGERPLDYIHHKKIERAQFLLLTTAMPLSVIAEETGFESFSYFSRIFKKIAGCTPGAYKQSHNDVI